MVDRGAISNQEEAVLEAEEEDSEDSGEALSEAEARVGVGRLNSKHQAPNSKQIQNSKFQIQHDLGSKTIAGHTSSIVSFYCVLLCLLW